MTHNSPDPLDRLLVALGGLARGLESGSPDAVLEAEAPLASAVSALTSADLDAVAARPDARAAIANVRLAMERCRTLGEAAADVSRVLAPSGYSAAGRRLDPSRRPPTVSTRT